MTTITRSEAFWHEYLETLDDDEQPESYTVWAFGDDPETGDLLADRVLRGAKRATCGALWEYEADREPLPREGEHSVILDGLGRPVAVIRTTEVDIRRFDEVDEDFARDEGEASLEEWRITHIDFFVRTLRRIGRAPSEDMPLVCQRFERVHPAKPSHLPPHPGDEEDDTDDA